MLYLLASSILIPPFSRLTTSHLKASNPAIFDLSRDTSIQLVLLHRRYYLLLILGAEIEALVDQFLNLPESYPTLSGPSKPAVQN